MQKYLYKLSYITLPAMLLLLIACNAGVAGRNLSPGTYKPSPQNGYKGLLSEAPLSENTIVYMEQGCQSFGGLNYSSIKEVSRPPGGSCCFNTWKEWSCNGPSKAVTELKPEPQLTNRPLENPKISLENAKSKCFDLGFKSETEGFGKCVLQLTK
jgi:hypothetical protein